jgi:hypothetical protein
LEIFYLAFLSRQLFLKFKRWRIFWRVLLSHARVLLRIVRPEINRYGLSESSANYVLGPMITT